MTCPSCGTAPPPLARFCPECGTAVQRRCAACGSALGAGHRFCASCGARADAAPATDEPAQSERRVSSVLFGDLVGFTGLAEKRDPEEVRELLSGYFDRCRDVVARYGGTIEKFIGDAVMAVWGVPVAHEDDAERAVRAGLDLVDAVTAFGERARVPDLAMRVGVVTGEVAVTVGATQQGMVAGDAVNTAARIQAKAEPGEVWVDEQTRALTSAAIAFTPAGTHELKGRSEAIALHRATAVMGVVGGQGRDLGVEAPLVGRRRELGLLKEVFQAAVEGGRGRLLLVTGSPGVGKTRLGWELQKYSDGLSAAIWFHWGRCPAYGDGVAYSALADAVRRRIDADDPTPAAEQQERLSAHLAEIVPDAHEREWLRPRLAVLLGGEHSYTREDLFAAWLTWFERISRGGDPVVWVIDDAHHADDALLDFVEHLVAAARVPLLLVLLGRPELLDRRARLAGSRRGTVIGLEGLSDEAMGELLDSLVADLPAAVRAQLAAGAEGIPLYAVETVRALLDQGLVRDDGRERRLAPEADAARLAELGAPASLQVLIASRLDALPRALHELAQHAAVLGSSFTLEGLEAVSELPADAVADGVGALIARDLVTRVADRFSPDFGRYVFVQAMVRQVAYRMQSRPARLRRHLAAARFLQSQTGSSGEVVAVVAQHLGNALELLPAGDPRTDELTDELMSWLERSGQRADALGVPGEAVTFYTQALRHARDGRDRARLRVLAARAAVVAGHWDQGLALASEDDDVEAVDLRAEAATVRATVKRFLGRPREAYQEVEPFLGQTDRLPPSIASTLLRVAARAHGELADPGEGRRLAEESLRRAEESGDAVLIGWALNDLAALMMFDDIRRVAVAVWDEAIAFCEARHAIPPLMAVLVNRGMASFTTDIRAAIRLYERSLEHSRQGADAFTLWLTTSSLMVSRLIAGRWDDDRTEQGTWLAEGLLDEGLLDEGLLDRLLHRALRALHSWARGEDPTTEVGTIDEAVLEGSRPDMAQEIDLIRLVRARLVDDVGAHVQRLAEAVVAGDNPFGGTSEWYPFLWTTAVDWLLESGTPADLAAARAATEYVAAAPGRRDPAVEAELPRLRATIALADRAAAPDLDAAERDLREAIPALEAYGAVPDRARAQAVLGQLLRERGREDEGRTLLADAGETFARIGAGNQLLRLTAAA